MDDRHTLVDYGGTGGTDDADHLGTAQTDQSGTGFAGGHPDCFFAVVAGLNIDTTTVGDIASIQGGFPPFNIPKVPFTLETLQIIFPYAAIVAGVVIAALVFAWENALRIRARKLTERYAALGKRVHLRHLSRDCQQLLKDADSIIEVNIMEDPTYKVLVNKKDVKRKQQQEKQ